MDEIGWAPSLPYNQVDSQGLSGEAANYDRYKWTLETAKINEGLGARVVYP